MSHKKEKKKNSKSHLVKLNVHPDKWVFYKWDYKYNDKSDK